MPMTNSVSKRGELVALLLLHLPVLMLPTSAEMKPPDVSPLMGSLRGANGHRVVAPCALSPQVAGCLCMLHATCACPLPARCAVCLLVRCASARGQSGLGLAPIDPVMCMTGGKDESSSAPCVLSSDTVSMGTAVAGIVAVRHSGSS